MFKTLTILHNEFSSLSNLKTLKRKVFKLALYSIFFTNTISLNRATACNEKRIIAYFLF